MNIIAVIPVRMSSSRFPGKPLKKINGVPMVELIYNNIKKNKNLTKVVVATCDQIIFDFIKSINGNVVLTSKKHKRATERTAEAVQISEKKYKKKFSIVVMVQGDEPMINNNMITEALKPFGDKRVNVVNLISKIKNVDTFIDKNCIKVVKDKNNNALYFSRSPIPNHEQKNNYYGYKQICVIPFRKTFLYKYLFLRETELEKKESVDMMRILENGHKIRLVEIKRETFPVDTLKDLIKVSKLLK